MTEMVSLDILPFTKSYWRNSYSVTSDNEAISFFISLLIYLFIYLLTYLGKCYQMSSFGENSAVKKASSEASSFVNYNKHQISRTYPAGIRVKSSNYDPVPMWTVGCHMGELVVCCCCCCCLYFFLMEHARILRR